MKRESIRERATQLKERLSEPEARWLEHAVDCYFASGRVPIERAIKADLDGKIPRDFSPRSIDDRLLKFERRLTPLGIIAVRPESSLLDHMQCVAERLREIAIESRGEEHTIEANQVAQEVGLSESDVGLAFEHLSNVELLPGASGSLEEAPGRDSVVLDDKTFDALYAFGGDLKEHIKEHYFQKKESKEEEAPPEQENFAAHVINPVFKGRVEHVDENLGFVIMPFDGEAFEALYDGVIRDVMEAEGYRCLRADESHGRVIMEDIWMKINQAGFVVADLTGPNPNVMYELGIAHTVGKPTVLLTQDLETLPFDLQHNRVIEYENALGEGKALEEKLPTAIEEAVNERKRRDEKSGIPLLEDRRSGAFVRAAVSGSTGFFGRSQGLT